MSGADQIPKTERVDPPPAGAPPLADPDAVTIGRDQAPPSEPAPPGTGPASGSTGRSTGFLRRSRRLDGAGDASQEVFGDRYALVREIARGGMGVVYEARQLDLDRVVALKVMLAGAYAGEDEARRFVLEAEASARLKHPHIVAVHDIGEVDGQLFFTMDLVEGVPLSKAKAGLSRPAALALMIQVAHAVAFAHARGIIHRDLKPQNIMVGPRGEPVIMDFGLAKQVGLDPERESSFATREGAVMGTPHYMPPEQAEGAIAEIDVQSDVWALGVMLYELFTGRLPFEGRGVSELLLAIFERDPLPPRRHDPTLDPDLEAVILKALEKPKARRYESAAALARDLEHVRDGLPVDARRATPLYRLQKWTRRHRAGVVAGALVLVALVSVTAVFVRQRGEAARRQDEERVGRRLAAALETVRLRERLHDERRAVASLLGATGDGPVEPRRGAALSVERGLGGLAEEAAAVRASIAGDEAARVDLDALTAIIGSATTDGARVVRLREAQGLLQDELPPLRAAAEAALATLVGGPLAAAGGGSPEEPSPGGWASLDDALAELEAAREAASAEGPIGAGVGPSFEESLRAARALVLRALSLAPAGGPEGRAAERELDALAWLERDRAVSDARRRARLVAHAAARVATAAERDRRAGGPALARLGAARRVEEVAQRARETLGVAGPGDAEAEALDAVRARAQVTAALALVDLRAFAVLDAELEGLDGADAAAVRSSLEVALQDRAGLERRLEAERPAAGDDAAALAARRARLDELAREAAGPGRDPELWRRHADLVREVEAALRERAYAEARAAVDAAREEVTRRPEDGPDGRLARAGALGAALAAAESRVGSLAAWLPEAERDGLLVDARRARAGLSLAAAAAAERGGDPARALGLAREARAAWGTPPAPAEDVALADAAVARLARLSAAPAGMLLVPGRARAALGADRGRVVDVGDFYLAARETTNGEWAAWLAADPTAPAPLGWTTRAAEPAHEELPVSGVTWEAARRFAAWRGARLPTDDEWELAARGPTGAARYPWGDAWSDEVLIADLLSPGKNPRDRTGLGLLDLGGNVSEWVCLTGPEADRPAVRGASWLAPLEPLARVTHRLVPRDPAFRGPQVGVRLAQDAR